MARGHKDYGDGGQTKIIHSVSDLGELAVRLGSPAVFERSGNIIWYDKLNHAYEQFSYGKAGVGADIFIDGDEYFRWGGALALISGDSDGDVTHVVNNVPSVDVTVFGSQVTFRPLLNSHEMKIGLVYDNASNAFAASILVDFTNQELLFLNTSGIYEKFADIDDLASEMDRWHTCKLVADFENNKYVRFSLGTKTYDLSAESVNSGVSAEVEYLYTHLQSIGGGGNNPQINFNDWIVTINEP